MNTSPDGYSLTDLLNPDISSGSGTGMGTVASGIGSRAGSGSGAESGAGSGAGSGGGSGSGSGAIGQIPGSQSYTPYEYDAPYGL